ncbi:MAG: purine-nucleoside phosphorylase, partial [Longimicrobiales bacterium]
MRPEETFPFGEALGALRGRLSDPPDVLLVLGSGLSGLAEGIPGAVSIPFQEIPGFPRAGVAGHAGDLVLGEMEDRAVLIQRGRFHLYEGHPAELIVAPVRLAAALGVRSVILTNAAGGIARDLDPGAILLLDDHLNLMWRSPLAGPVQEGEARFPDMADPYDQTLRARALEVAR